MSFPDLLAARADEIQRFLENALDGAKAPLRDPMCYALSGGKRLRGFLVLETARLHDVDPSRAIWPAGAIEALHAYSLVHDDLPCMDDDALRRGHATVHVKWNEATAVLVGDALQSLAYELLTKTEVGPADARVALMASLAKASGAQGMVLGQAMDIAAETSDVLDLEQITALQANKTGALIEWSCEAGAILANADPVPLRSYAQALGLAFQIADDVLDIEGDAAIVGKATGKDTDAGKATYVSLLGLNGAKRRASELVTQACEALSIYGADAECLRECARFVISRRN